LILHGGDLADGGASPAEIVDRIRDLGWQGVVGNTDEMLYSPKSLQGFASQSPKLQPLFAAIEEMAVATREALKEERLTWSAGARARQSRESLARTPAYSQRCRVGVGLLAARPADCHLCAYPSLIYSERFRNDRR
jgi:hypothetical protein